MSSEQAPQALLSCLAAPGLAWGAAMPTASLLPLLASCFVTWNCPVWHFSTGRVQSTNRCEHCVPGQLRLTLTTRTIPKHTALKSAHWGSADSQVFMPNPPESSLPQECRRVGMSLNSDCDQRRGDCMFMMGRGCWLPPPPYSLQDGGYTLPWKPHTSVWEAEARLSRSFCDNQGYKKSIQHRQLKEQEALRENHSASSRLLFAHQPPGGTRSPEVCCAPERLIPGPTISTSASTLLPVKWVD